MSFWIVVGGVKRRDKEEPFMVARTTGTGAARRRRSDREVLPSSANADAPKYGNSKRRRGRKMREAMALMVAGALVLAAVFVIATFLSSSHDNPPSWTHKFLIRTDSSSSSSSSRRISSRRQKGCHNADIHAIVNEEANPPAICINDIHILPENWRAPDDVVFKDPGGPWTAEEQALADEAVDEGLNELISFFEEASDERIRGLGIDASSSVFDYVISSEGMPKFHQRAVDTAIKVLEVSVEDYIKDDSDDNVECIEMFAKATFSGYAHRLSMEAPKDLDLKRIRDRLVDHLNKSFEKCGSLDMVFTDGVADQEEPWRKSLEEHDLLYDEASDWVAWSSALINCLTIPDLEMPEETNDFLFSAWKFFGEYGIPSYVDYEEEEDRRGSFEEMAYLATHIQFVSTGYGRHYCYVRHAPFLYQYYRQNYYAAMSAGHDLFAEFVDVLMGYGCTAENDVQVRHGLRYMLHLYEQANHTFVNELEDWESNKKDLSDYDIIHKPWTGVASLETNGCFEPELPGSYGHAFREAMASGSSS